MSSYIGLLNFLGVHAQASSSTIKAAISPMTGLLGLGCEQSQRLELARQQQFQSKNYYEKWLEGFGKQKKEEGKTLCSKYLWTDL